MEGLGQTVGASALVPQPGDQACLSWGLQDPQVPGASCLDSESYNPTCEKSPSSEAIKSVSEGLWGPLTLVLTLM